MKVLLLKDVYKLGRAGDVKKVADGYGRNYLIPQGLAVLATRDALKMVDRIRVSANQQREVLNKELSGVAERIDGTVLVFPARASETGRLYGSVTTHMIAEAIQEKAGVEVTRRQVDTQPLRELGEFTVPVRLTVDLIPHIKVIVYREGEAVPQVESVAEPQNASTTIEEETEAAEA
jgi:large subunit ribosomal protein L9